MRIIRKNSEFRQNYHRLGSGDVVATVLRWEPGEEGLLLDLQTRGVHLFPPALAQWLSRSKVLQAQVLGPWMVPGTMVVTGRRGLLKAMEDLGRRHLDGVVTKEDRGDCGLGVHRWNSLEEVFNHSGSGPLSFPFVLQPFIAGALDVRVIWIGDYQEAYWRRNPNSFRNNLRWGGESGPYFLSQEQEALCRQVMERAAFPYAFMDLLISPDGATYLSEISLRGGLHGARLSQRRYLELVEAAAEEFISSLTGDTGEVEQESSAR